MGTKTLAVRLEVCVYQEAKVVSRVFLGGWAVGRRAEGATWMGAVGLPGARYGPKEGV